MTFTGLELLQGIAAVLIAIGGAKGLSSLFNLRIDKRKSVESSLFELTEVLKKEISRVDEDRRRDNEEAKKRETALTQELEQMRLNSAKRERELQEQITQVQRQAADREQALQLQISQLNELIVKKTQEIDVLRQQIKAQGGG